MIAEFASGIANLDKGANQENDFDIASIGSRMALRRGEIPGARASAVAEFLGGEPTVTMLPGRAAYPS